MAPPPLEPGAAAGFHTTPRGRLCWNNSQLGGMQAYSSPINTRSRGTSFPVNVEFPNSTSTSSPPLTATPIRCRGSSSRKLVQDGHSIRWTVLPLMLRRMLTFRTGKGTPNKEGKVKPLEGGPWMKELQETLSTVVTNGTRSSGKDSTRRYRVAMYREKLAAARVELCF